ncbi:MAG: N-acetyltransferase family protein [Planctomycetota bacterium]
MGDPENDVRVRRAGAGDLELARRAVADVNGHASADREALAAFLGDEASYLLVAEVDAEAVGSLIGHRLPTPYAARPHLLLYEIDVLSAWRRKGIGRRLVEAFLEEARALDARGAWVVTNRSNAAAMALYRACGLTATAPDDVVSKLV